MSHVKQYQRLLRTACIIMGGSLPRNESDDDCLQIEVKCACDIIEPDSLSTAAYTHLISYIFCKNPNRYSPGTRKNDLQGYGGSS